MTTFDQLAALCRNASEAVLAAPYARCSALRRLLLAKIPRITIFVRGTPADFLAGSCDLELPQYASEIGADLYICPLLHAKYYRADSKVLIGSANLSDRGLGLTRQQPNLEILCPPSDTFDMDKFERELLEKSTLVTPGLNSALRESVETLAKNQLAIPTPDQLAEWTPQAASPAYLWDRYTGKTGQIPLAEQRANAERDLEALQLPSSLSEIAFHAWLRAILLTAPLTASIIANYLATDSKESAPIQEPTSLQTLAWWNQVTTPTIR